MLKQGDGDYTGIMYVREAMMLLVRNSRSGEKYNPLEFDSVSSFARSKTPISDKDGGQGICTYIGSCCS